jgi:hypothetical protein
MDIESIYHSYLVDVENERNKDMEKGVFHASSSGSCYKKQLYNYFEYEPSQKDKKSYRILRLGTILHKDIEDAINRHKSDDSIIFTEDHVEIKELNVVGTYDAGEYMDNKDFNLYDIKTAAAYKWTTKFGRKENRKSGGDTNYKMQLGTYAIGIKNKYDVNRINMSLLWYNKNTSMMREQLVNPKWIDESYQYWKDLNEILDDVGEDFVNELEPNFDLGVPFQDWECNYCQFSNICLNKK